MTELSQNTKELIFQHQNWYRSLQPKKEISTIHVDEVASKVAAFYERIRGIIDWKEEHLLKRGAIERILKRRFLIQMDIGNGNSQKKLFAEPLILELIRGGHFPNDAIKESKIEEVQRAINKYIFILSHPVFEQKKSPYQNKFGTGQAKLQLYSWISEIAACEIEEILSPSLKERALIIYMFESMKEKIKLNEGIIKIKSVSEKEKNIQVYIAVQRALFKLDAPVISYQLLKYWYPEWRNLSENQVKELAKNIYLIQDNIKKELNNPLADKFYQICEKYDTPYLILGDIISADPMRIESKISEPETFESLIRKAYNKRLKTLKSRLGRAAFYSTLSIFLTNIISLLAVEIPFTKYVTGNFNFLAIGIDILGPTFLMAFLVVTIKPPKRENLERVVMEDIKIAYKREKKDVYEIKSFPKRGFIINAIIDLLYILIFGLFLALIIWGLYKINFPPLSYIIFIIFLSLIAFAGAKIKERAKELQIIEEKETFLRFIIDPFAIPVIQLGKWLTVRWKRYNIIAAFFSALIDMPFMVFIEFLEQWRYFLKEKKEKIH